MAAGNVDAEQQRINAARTDGVPWRKWGHICQNDSGARSARTTATYARRLVRIFLRHDRGRRPVYGGPETFQNDPHWRGSLPVLRIFPWGQWRGPRSQPSD